LDRRFTDTFWYKLDHLIKKGNRLIALDDEANIAWMSGTEKHDLTLLIASPYVWTNHVTNALREAIERTQGVVRVGREDKLTVHLIADQIMDLHRLGEIRLPIKGKIDLEYTLAQEFEEADRYKAHALQLDQERKKQDQSFFDYGTPGLTYLLMFACVLIFSLMERTGSTLDTAHLIAYGAKYNPAIEAGEWWRLITAAFLHIGFLHLFINMIALFSLGPLCERIYGSPRFLFVYLLAGATASLFSFATNPSVSAGASGALFGLVGMLFYFGMVERRLFMRTLGPSLFVIIGINALFAVISPMALDHAAHLGGLTTGFVTTRIVGHPKENAPRLRLLYGAGFVIIILGLLAVGKYF